MKTHYCRKYSGANQNVICSIQCDTCKKIVANQRIKTKQLEKNLINK